jgi:hypothetical protein
MTKRKSLATEKLRLITEQADSEELDFTRRVNALIERASVEQLALSCDKNLINRLDGRADALTPMLVAETNPAAVRERLKDEIRAIREAMAQKARAELAKASS